VRYNGAEVARMSPALAILFCGIASGAAPFYSAAGIVSTAGYAPAPFAPNSLVTIFGTDLAIATHLLGPADMVNGALPTEMVSTRVYLDDQPAPLLFVSAGQINFLIPGQQGNKPTPIRVVRAGQTGPEIFVTVTDAAPGLFVSEAGFAIATHADNCLIAPEKPAVGGELIVIYATGLGKTETMPNGGEVPPYISQLVNRAALKVMLNGVAVDPARVLYAGLTPTSVGLYQVNVILPENPGPDPELRLFVGDAGSQAGLKLPLR
jgi:uncharacterized protein (TIGR03437 family)